MYYCSNCHPDKVVHAGHGDLALGLLTGLPQPPGEVHVYVHVHAFHFTPQVDGAFNAIKGLATKCCSIASCYICDYADSLFKDDSPSSTKSPKDASSASTKSPRRG